jgi:uncharacterized protein YraI
LPKTFHRCAPVLSVVFLALGMYSGYAFAQETVIIKRDTQLRQGPSDSSNNIAALPAQTSVTRTPVRRGAWVQVESLGVTGWVHMFDLAAPESAKTAAANTSNNPLTEGLRGLGSIFGGGGKTSTVPTSTAGAKGFGAGDISTSKATNRNSSQATSDHEALSQVESQRVSAVHAQAFARSAGLQTRSIHSLPTPPSPAETTAPPTLESASKSPLAHDSNEASHGFDLMESGN